jgi:hypothetical protein
MYITFGAKSKAKSVKNLQNKKVNNVKGLRNFVNDFKGLPKKNATNRI